MANQPNYVVLPMRSGEVRHMPISDIGRTFDPSLVAELAYCVHPFTNLLENDATAYVTDEPMLRYLQLQTTDQDVIVCDSLVWSAAPLPHSMGDHQHITVFQHAMQRCLETQRRGMTNRTLCVLPVHIASAAHWTVVIRQQGTHICHYLDGMHLPLPPFIQQCIDVWQHFLFNDVLPIQRPADTPLQNDSVNCAFHVVSNVLRAVTGQHGYANPHFNPCMLRIIMWNALVEHTHDIQVHFNDDHHDPAAHQQSPPVTPCTIATSPRLGKCISEQSSEGIKTLMKLSNTTSTTTAHNPSLPVITAPSIHLMPPPVTAQRMPRKRVATKTHHKTDDCPRVSIHRTIQNHAYHQFLTFITASNFADQPMEWDTARSLTAAWIQASAMLEHAICKALPLVACDEPVPDFSHFAPSDTTTTFVLPIILDHQFLCSHITTSKCVIFASWAVVITKPLRAFLLAVTTSLLRSATRRQPSRSSKHADCLRPSTTPTHAMPSSPLF